jgi:lysylphosphatidylglycerol synthetase-like protein (DUF2156 family)
MPGSVDFGGFAERPRVAHSAASRSVTVCQTSTPFTMGVKGRREVGTERGMPASRSGWVTLVAVLYLISGALGLLVGLAALGVSLSGSATVETTYLGDWPTNDLEGAAVVMIVLGALQLLIGAGISRRDRWAWIAGLVASSLVIVTHIFFHRLLDGWALGGLLTNLVIIWILVVKEAEFSGRRG